MWNEGIQTEDIDSSLLMPYLKDDVMNTHIVFDKQLIEADRLGMLPLIMSQMEALKCTIEMEYNGMHFERDKALNVANLIKKDLTSMSLEFDDIVHTNLRLDIGMVFNPNSSKHAALVLFGGEYSITSTEDVLNTDGWGIGFSKYFVINGFKTINRNMQKKHAATIK